MNLTEHEIKNVSRSLNEKYTLYPIGDIHLGTKNCDLKKLINTVEKIRNEKNALWMGMGDYCEFINYSDAKRFDAKSIPENLLRNLDNLHLEQVNQVAKILMPIKDKCIGLLSGNHEETIRARYHTDVAEVLAYKLGAKNLGYSAFVRLHFISSKNNTRNVTIYAHHGHGGGRAEGTGINNLVEKSKSFESDIYLMGHVHRKICLHNERICMAGTKNGLCLVAKKRIYAITGTFYKTYEVDQRSYAEKGGFPPTPTGSVKITIYPFAKKRDGKRVVDLPPQISASEE